MIKAVYPDEGIIYMAFRDETGKEIPGPIFYFGLNKGSLDMMKRIVDDQVGKSVIRYAKLSILEENLLGLIVDFRATNIIIIIHQEFAMDPKFFRVVKKHQGRYQIYLGPSDETKMENDEKYLDNYLRFEIEKLCPKEDYLRAVSSSQILMNEFMMKPIT